MLSYKEYKLLNESLYGAINLGVKNPNSIIDSPIGANGVTNEVEAETQNELELEEAKTEKCKCGKMMKKGMSCDCEKEDHEDKDHEDKDHEDKDHEDKDHEDKDEGLSDAQKKLPKALQKAILNKKNKKEWSEILADFEDLLEGKEESIVAKVNSNLENIKKLLETKEMTEDEKAWWDSVNSQLGPEAGTFGFAPVGKITQAIR